jgi:hypothetical protein
LNKVFPSSSIDPKVEELGVCIALLNVSNTGTLLFSCPLNHGEGNHFPLESCPKVPFVCIESSRFLRQVKVQNDKQGGVHKDLSVGEELPTPLGECQGCALQLVEKNMARFNVRRRLIPSMLDHLQKTGDPNPKVFELERPTPFGPPIIGEQEGAMVRQRRGESIEHMRSKAKIPLGVAIESVKLAKRWIFPLIAPSESSSLCSAICAYIKINQRVSHVAELKMQSVIECNFT